MALVAQDELTAQLSQLLPGQSQQQSQLLCILADEGRPALLQYLKQTAGVAKLGDRQRLANSLCRVAREEEARAEKAKLPVIFIHTGYRPYVEVAIRLTASHHQPIVVLGDDSMQRLECIPGVEVVDVAPYRDDDAIRMARLRYAHYSSNPASFEFFCFERIFILRRFLQSRGLERCFHLDSDCALLQPLSAFPHWHKHKVWLVNNDFYQTYGFSPLPSSSVHASLLDVDFCLQVPACANATQAPA